MGFTTGIRRAFSHIRFSTICSKLHATNISVMNDHRAARLQLLQAEAGFSTTQVLLFLFMKGLIFKP